MEITLNINILMTKMHMYKEMCIDLSEACNRVVTFTNYLL